MFSKVFVMKENEWKNTQFKCQQSLLSYTCYLNLKRNVFLKIKNKLNKYNLTTFLLYFSGKMKYISLSKPKKNNLGIMKNSLELIKEKQMSLILLYYWFYLILLLLHVLLFIQIVLKKVIIFIVYVVVIFLNALYIQLTGFKSSNQH